MLRLTLLTWCSAALGFTPTGTETFAVFGNAHTRVLIKQWSPKPIPVSSGSVLLPASEENWQRYVAAMILLNDPSVGSIASAGVSNGEGESGISVIVTKFTGAEHQLLMPLWQPKAPASTTFRKLAEWHHERLSDKLLSGAHIARPEDRAAWAEALHLP